eukprot:UN2565
MSRQAYCTKPRFMRCALDSMPEPPAQPHRPAATCADCSIHFAKHLQQRAALILSDSQGP